MTRSASSPVESDKHRHRRLGGDVRVVRIALPVLGPRTLAFGALVLVVVIAATAYAAFSSSVAVTPSLASGSMTLTPGATGAKTNRFDISATDMAAGDTVQRTLDLTVGGTIATKELDLLLTASPSTALDTNAAGLTILIEKCSGPTGWDEAGPPYTYTVCPGGSITTVWAVEPVVTMKARNTFALIPGTVSGVYHLKFTLTMPAGAAPPNTELATFSPGGVGLSSTLSFAFSGPQRDATNV